MRHSLRSLVTLWLTGDTLEMLVARQMIRLGSQ